MKSIHNCDELIKFLVNEFSSYPLDCVEFQGDVVDITMTDYTYEELGFIVDNTLISIASSVEGYFDVKACTTPIKFGESVKSICIPDYVKNELIATLSGEWLIKRGYYPLLFLYKNNTTLFLFFGTQGCGLTKLIYIN